MPGTTRYLPNTFISNSAGHGFTDFGGGTLIVDPNAFVFSLGNTGHAVSLVNGPWTVTINGNLFSDGRIGLSLLDGDLTRTSNVTVGKSGEVYGNGLGPFDGIGITANHNVRITNSGAILADVQGAGNGLAISHNGNGTMTINNLKGGLIESFGGAISSGVLAGGDGVHTVANAGTIRGIDNSISFTGSSNDVVRNSGLLDGKVDLGAGNDYFQNTGTVDGDIDMGAGNDTFIGGRTAEIIYDGNGGDIYRMGAGNDEVRLIGLGSDLDDTFDGGTGVDTLDTSATSSSMVINIDTVTHSDALTSTTQVARKLTGASAFADTISNFENVYGGGSSDVIFGSSAANFISGGGGADAIYGYAGNDTIYGDNGGDRIYGGLGKDYMDGGAFDGAQDYFFFTSLKDSGVTAATRDVIASFTLGEDFIDLSAIDANSLVATDQAFNYIGQNVAFGTGPGAAGQLRSYWNATHTIIEADVNGDAKADFSIALEGNLTMTGAGTDYFTL